MIREILQKKIYFSSPSLKPLCNGRSAHSSSLSIISNSPLWDGRLWWSFNCRHERNGHHGEMPLEKTRVQWSAGRGERLLPWWLLAQPFLKAILNLVSWVVTPFRWGNRVAIFNRGKVRYDNFIQYFQSLWECGLLYMVRSSRTLLFSSNDCEPPDHIHLLTVHYLIRRDPI